MVIMLGLELLKTTFKKGAISKPDYIKKMHSLHLSLFEYSEYIKKTDASKIEITPSEVVLTVKSSGVKLMFDQRDFHKIFTSLFKKYLPYNTKFTCLEVGCVPGSFLINFHKLFGYKIYGVDYSDRIDLFNKNMKVNRIKNYKVWKADILKFRPNIKFDVVVSFGLIEHFLDPAPYVTKMASLVKKGGYYIIHLPNFRNLQYIIHYLSNKDLFKTHYLEFMDANKLEELVKKVTPIKTLYSGYYGIIQDFPYKNIFPHNVLHNLSHSLNIIINKLSFDVLLANPWTSTETVYIGNKL